MRHSKTLKNTKTSLITTAAGSAVISCVIVVSILLLLGFLVAKIDATDVILSAMSTFALCIGAFSGGYISGKRRKRNGLVLGILCGIFIFLVIIVMSHLFSRAAESFSMPVKLILTLLFAGIGGVVGVNSKNGRY